MKGYKEKNNQSEAHTGNMLLPLLPLPLFLSTTKTKHWGADSLLGRASCTTKGIVGNEQENRGDIVDCLIIKDRKTRKETKKRKIEKNKEKKIFPRFSIISLFSFLSFFFLI